MRKAVTVAPVTARRLGTLLLLAVVGVAAGFGLAAMLAGQEPSRFEEVSPVPARSPSVPAVPEPTVAPYGPDIKYPALVPPTRFTRHRISNDLQTWSYIAPKDWTAYDVTDDSKIPATKIETRGEVRFRPADEPTVGGYSLRVKVVDDHVSTATMVENKLDALEDVTDVVVLDQTDDSLYFTYRALPSERLRYNFFRWFAAPGVTEATLEMSVVGRKDDEVGLRGFFEQFRSGLRPIA
jgi:hypothetical protein